MPIEPSEEIRGDDKITLLREQIAQVDLVVDTESLLQQYNAGSGFVCGFAHKSAKLESVIAFERLEITIILLLRYYVILYCGLLDLFLFFFVYGSWFFYALLIQFIC